MKKPKYNEKHVERFTERHLLLQGYLPHKYLSASLKNAQADLEKESQKINPSRYELALSQELINGLKKERLDFQKADAASFKKEYGRSISDTINRAKQKNEHGNKDVRTNTQKAIYDLVEWDIRWLFSDWVKEKIIIAYAVDDRGFITKLANAIKSRRNKNKTTHERFYSELKHLKVMKAIDFNDPKQVNWLRNEILKKYDEQNISDKHPVYKLVRDNNYFCKWLKRKCLRGTLNK